MVVIKKEMKGLGWGTRGWGFFLWGIWILRIVRVLVRGCWVLELENLVKIFKFVFYIKGR